MGNMLYFEDHNLFICNYYSGRWFSTVIYQLLAVICLVFFTELIFSRNNWH